jgi:hypothetical protein
MRKAILTISLLLIITATARPQLVSFKLTGGLSWIDGGDYNKGIAGENRYIKDTSSAMTGSYKELNNGLNVLAEVIVNASKHLAVGFGGGYYRIGNESTVSIQGVQSGVPFESGSISKPSLSVIPMFLNLHYLMRLGSKLDLDVFAGPLFQVVQFNFTDRSTMSISSVSQTLTFRSSTTSLGVQAGLGVNFKIFPGVALFVESGYRYAKISNLMGNWAVIGDSAAGPINKSSAEYFFWTYHDTSGSGYPRIDYFDNNGPTGGSVSGARKADINLSGITASCGIRYSF